MDDKHVTHKELEANTEKMLHQMDNQFANLREDLNKEFRSIDQYFNKIERKTDSRFNKIEQKTDNHFNEIEQKTNSRFNNIDKNINTIKLDLNDVKNTANSNKEKINWILYTAMCGVFVTVIGTLITNLLIK